MILVFSTPVKKGRPAPISRRKGRQHPSYRGASFLLYALNNRQPIKKRLMIPLDMAQ
jgi:hypothetical protein